MLWGAEYPSLQLKKSIILAWIRCARTPADTPPHQLPSCTPHGGCRCISEESLLG